MPIHVHLLYPPEPKDLNRLQLQLRSEIQLTTGSELPNPARFEILVAGRPSRAHLDASPDLETLIIPWAGLPDTTRVLLQDYPDLAVHNLHHNAPMTAELALGLLLAAAKFILPFDQSLRQANWWPRYNPSPAKTLMDESVLILGYGAIGRRVGRVCDALGMDVLGIRRSAAAGGEPDPPAIIFPLEALEELLPRARFLIITLPHTPETEGLLGAAELNLLPPGSVLVNVGRAAVIDQGALFQALASRRLASAGLDVWYHYPAEVESRAYTAPADYPFHELDNVVLSPHRGGLVADIESYRMKALAEMLNEAAQGKPLPNRVDIQAGY